MLAAVQWIKNFEVYCKTSKDQVVDFKSMDLSDLAALFFSHSMRTRENRTEAHTEEIRYY